MAPQVKRTPAHPYRVLYAVLAGDASLDENLAAWIEAETQFRRREAAGAEFVQRFAAVERLDAATLRALDRDLRAARVDVAWLVGALATLKEAERAARKARGDARRDEGRRQGAEAMRAAGLAARTKARQLYEAGKPWSKDKAAWAISRALSISFATARDHLKGRDSSQSQAIPREGTKGASLPTLIEPSRVL